MRTTKILNARGLISPVPMTPGRFLSDPIGMLPGGAEPCLATPAKNSTLRFARSSTCIRQVCDRFDRRTVCSSFTTMFARGQTDPCLPRCSLPVLVGVGPRRRSASQAIDLKSNGGVNLGCLFTRRTASHSLNLGCNTLLRHHRDCPPRWVARLNFHYRTNHPRDWHSI